MTIVMFIIVGAIIGWIASRLMGREEGFFGSMVIGIVGAFIGSLFAELFRSSGTSYMSLSWSGFIWSLIGAIILVAILNGISGRRHHPINR